MRAALLAVAACGTAPVARPAPVVAAYDPSATVEVARDEVTITAPDHDVPGTLVHPATGRWPAIVMFPGSGPTDRDWNNPLLAGKNGSAKLLAEELARHGLVVLRFDKAGIGGNKLAWTQIGATTYADEGRAALAYLRTRPEVDPARLFVLGNSEGGIHAIRTALAEGPAVHGVILMASAGRSMKTTVVGQVAAQFDTAIQAGGFTREAADQQLAAMTKAFDDFAAGQTIDPTAVTPIPGIQQLIAAFVNPATATMMRGLLVYDPAEGAAKLAVPVLVMNGQKDIQVDPERDAKRLAKAIGSRATLALIPDANHVFKHEARTVDELHANVAAAQASYNAEASVLEPAAIAALERWLAEHTR